MSLIRVCHLITELRPAGAERLVYELAVRLDRRRFEPSVVAFRGGAVADQLREAGVDVHVLGMRRKWDLPRLIGLPRLLRQIRPDILHTHLFHADLAGRLSAALAGVRHVVHSVHVAEQRFRPWQFGFARLAGPWCRRIVCVSRAVADHHRRLSGLPADRYQVIYNGIDVARFSRDLVARTRLRHQWGVREDEPLVVFVGRLDPQKAPEVLMDAMALLERQGPHCRCVLAGDGPLRAAMERRLAGSPAAGSIRLLGHWDDVPGLLSAGDILAMPSRWEGFGLAAAEAMAAKLPVVATAVPGLTEVVADGHTGLLVPPDNAGALADAVARLAGDADLRQTMGRAGRERVQELFRIEECVARHERLYAEVVV